MFDKKYARIAATFLILVLIFLFGIISVYGQTNKDSVTVQPEQEACQKEVHDRGNTNNPNSGYIEGICQSYYPQSKYYFPKGCEGYEFEGEKLKQDSLEHVGKCSAHWLMSGIKSMRCLGCHSCPTTPISDNIQASGIPCGITIKTRGYDLTDGEIGGYSTFNKGSNWREVIMDHERGGSCNKHLKIKNSWGLSRTVDGKLELTIITETDKQCTGAADWLWWGLSGCPKDGLGGGYELSITGTNCRFSGNGQICVENIDRYPITRNDETKATTWDLNYCGDGKVDCDEVCEPDLEPNCKSDCTGINDCRSVGCPDSLKCNSDGRCVECIYDRDCNSKAVCPDNGPKLFPKECSAGSCENVYGRDGSVSCVDCDTDTESCGGNRYHCTNDGSTWAWRKNKQAEICDDGINNDCDSFTDCEDYECAGQQGPNGVTCCRWTPDCNILDNCADNRHYLRVKSCDSVTNTCGNAVGDTVAGGGIAYCGPYTNGAENCDTQRCGVDSDGNIQTYYCANEGSTWNWRLNPPEECDPILNCWEGGPFNDPRNLGYMGRTQVNICELDDIASNNINQEAWFEFTLNSDGRVFVVLTTLPDPLNSDAGLVGTDSMAHYEDTVDTLHYNWLWDNFRYGRTLIDSWDFNTGMPLGEWVESSPSPSYDVGDVVSFPIPSGLSETISGLTHRIVKINPDGTYIIKGDNNDGPIQFASEEDFSEYNIDPTSIMSKDVDPPLNRRKDVDLNLMVISETSSETICSSTNGMEDAEYCKFAGGDGETYKIKVNFIDGNPQIGVLSVILVDLPGESDLPCDPTTDTCEECDPTTDTCIECLIDDDCTDNPKGNKCIQGGSPVDNKCGCITANSHCQGTAQRCPGDIAEKCDTVTNECECGSCTVGFNKNQDCDIGYCCTGNDNPGPSTGTTCISHSRWIADPKWLCDP